MGVGPGIPGLQLGLGAGAGCGLGLGFGYGVGRGIAFDYNRRYSNVARYVSLILASTLCGVIGILLILVPQNHFIRFFFYFSPKTQTKLVFI